MANEFVVKNGLIVSGSTNVSGSVTAFSFTGSFSGSFSGSTVAPGSTTQILFNSGGLAGTDPNFVYSGSRLGINTNAPRATTHVTQYDPTLPALPAGYQFLVSNQGQYITDNSGNYVVGVDPVNYASASFIVDSAPFSNVIFVAGQSVGINTGLPNSGSLHVNGNVYATSFTGSLSGTATNAVSSSYALSASYALNATNAVNAISASYVNGTVVAPGSNYDILQNIGGNIGSIGNFQYEIIGDVGTLTMLNGSQLTFIGPSGPFLTTNGPTGIYRFTQYGNQYIELNDAEQSLKLAAGGTVLATVDSYSQGVGVGITNPTARLHVKGTGATDATTGLRVENANTSASLIVLDDGKVGINTSSPTQTLEVNGGIGFNGNSYHTSGEIITQYQESFLTPGQYFYLINPTGGGFGPDTVGINYYITSYSGYGLEVGGTTKFHNSVDFGLFANLTLTSGSLEVTGSTNITGSLNVTGPITNNGVNIQALSIAYAVALG